GSSQALGKLSVALKNHLPTSLTVTYLETMPWLVQFYLHTLKVHINGSPNGKCSLLSDHLLFIRSVDNTISNISYTPAIPRSRPTTFQTVLTVPPNSKLEISIEVAKAFLRYTEHPPDAQRGWDLPPGIFSLGNLVSNSSFDRTPKRQRI